jgi:uncharacterized membrane protein
LVSGKKSCFLLTVIIVLSALLRPCNVLAQDIKDGLILRQVTDGYDSEIIPGESKTFYIEATNDSGRPIANISFTYNGPKEWMVEYTPQSIDVIDTNSYRTIEVHVTAPKDVRRGNYPVTIIADSDAGRRVMSIYIRVEQGNTLWMWVGVVLGVLAIATFIIIFRRFSRD